MRYEPEIRGYSIVMLGHFNPRILSPIWLMNHELIDKAEFEASEIEVIHPELSRFRVGTMALDCTPSRFSCSTDQDPSTRIVDLVLSLFGEVLSHTPAKALGINAEIHFSVDSIDQRTAFGHALAPLAMWGSLGERIRAHEREMPGGLVSLTMRELISAERPYLRRDFTIEPSKRIKNNKGIYMRMNQHHAIAKDDADIDFSQVDGSESIIELLRQNFDDALSTANALFSEMMETASAYKFGEK